VTQKAKRNERVAGLVNSTPGKRAIKVLYRCVPSRRENQGFFRRTQTYVSAVWGGKEGEIGREK